MQNIKLDSFLLGLGLDPINGHKRFTKGENYYIFGGSKQTHQKIQKICAKFNQELGHRHKTIKNISSQEFFEIAAKIGLKTSKR